MQEQEINELLIANEVAQFSYVTSIPLSLIVINIISRVHGMQMSHAKGEQNI